MKERHLTDLEVQLFAMGEPGQDPAIVQHIAACSGCRLKVNDYQLLFAGLKDQEAPVFDFDLARLVIHQLQPVRQASDQLRYWMIAAGIVVSGITVFLFKDYLFVANGFPVMLAIICTVPVLLFLFAETSRNYRKRMKLLEI